MMQSVNKLILGIELREEYAQLTYFHPSVKEPVTVGKVTDSEDTMIPMGLRQKKNGIWELWDGEKTDSEDDVVQISNIYREPSEERFTEYFRLCINSLRILSQDAEIYVMVTVRKLTEYWSGILVKALENNGIDRKQIYLQDYHSSFYYYAVNQKKELWYQDAALLEYEDEAIVGYVLHIDRSTKPAMAQVKKVASQPMGDAVRGDRTEEDWKKEKDRLFFELLKKVFDRRSITVSYLIGDYFNKSWAERSIQYLCYKRHAFQGQNLYSKGACYAAMERAGLLVGRDVIYGGEDMVDRNIGMDMRIRGKNSYYPLVTAGINWYEVYHSCEFILNGEREIRVASQPMSPEEEPVMHLIRLPGLPVRPDRATRMKLTLYFSAADKCHIEVEDLGFGGFYKASGLRWKRTLTF